MNEHEPKPFDKNFLIAIALCLAFFLGWSWWMSHRYSSADSAPAVTAAPASVPSSVSPAPSSLPVVPRHEAASAKTWTYSGSDTQVTVDVQNGRLARWIVRDSGDSVDLVLHEGASQWLATQPQGNFDVVENQKHHLRLRAVLENGSVVEKSFDFAPGRLPRFEIRWENPTRQSVHFENPGFWMGPGLGTSLPEKKENPAHIRTIYIPKSEARHLKAGKDASGPFQWFGIDNRYFLFAFIPVIDASLAQITHLSVRDKEEGALLLADAPVQLQPGQKLRWAFDLYVGHKGYDHLKKFGKDLEAGIDFGFFGSIAKLLFKIMLFFYGITHNYGWAIILLTLVVQVVLSPLTIKSFSASAAMQKLQPQLKLLQESYKDNPKALNVEMMKLYRREGVNPLGGCLPMILQIPIFFALYTTIRNAYELRGAPFMFWIKDLSVHDPYYVLPIVMGGSMLAQQKMMSVSIDPMQQKIMMLMPVVFTFMFLKFPSGLVLYWLVNNVTSISIQWVIKKRAAAAA